MILQILCNGLVASGRYLLVAAGFWLILRCLRFFDLAYGAMFTLGAYLTLFFTSHFRTPVLLASPLAVLVTMSFAALLHACVYAPLSRKRASPLLLLLASLGAYLVLQNTISLIWGDDTKWLHSGSTEKTLQVFGATISGNQALLVAVSVVATAALALTLKGTRVGLIVRSIANNPDLAVGVGVDTGRVRLLVYAASCGMAALAGSLVGLDLNIAPSMGMNAMFMGVIAVVIGGTRHAGGAALGAILLGMSQQIGALAFGVGWQDVTVFSVLLLFLFFKPYGFFARPPTAARA